MDMLFRNRRYRIVIGCLLVSTALFIFGRLTEPGFIQIVLYVLGIFTVGIAVDKSSRAYVDAKQGKAS